MSLGISKDCFPPPTECHNCLRKKVKEITKHTEQEKEYKRCSSCHVMTYCDQDCQREHWIKVHKKHCRFLSGKTPVKNNKHDAATCNRCIQKRETSLDQLRSEDSPKTICIIEEVITAMKKLLGELFGFHKEGRTCNCSLEFVLELPFPLGEVSGKYAEFCGTGIDAMLAHAFNILAAMILKCKKQEVYKNALIELMNNVVQERSFLWYDVLVCGNLGRRVYHSRDPLYNQAVNLRAIYGASDPWWKILIFSLDFVDKAISYLPSNLCDFQSLEDPRFQHFKQIYVYMKSQLRNQSTVCENQMWPKFMLWPQLVNGSLAMVLPPGTSCQNCFAPLSGEVAVTNHEANYKNLPSLILSAVGDNGAVMASCPLARNQSCRIICSFKNVIHGIQSDEDLMKVCKEEDLLFAIETRECDFCLKSSLSSHRCSACLTVQYCSIVCQKKDLDFHKTVCSTWAKDKSRRIIGKGKQKDHWKSYFAEK